MRIFINLLHLIATFKKRSAEFNYNDSNEFIFNCHDTFSRKRK